MKNETIKIICPNCQEDITYYFNKGKAQEQERILNIIDECKNWKLLIKGNVDVLSGEFIETEELKKKIKGDEE